MLATAAALQLLVLVQVSAPPPDAPDPAPGEERDPAAPAPGMPPAADAPDARTPARAGQAAPERPRQQSLLSAESLHGGSAALAWVGWPDLGAMYGIGFTQRDDAGVLLSHDWAKSETRVGVFYRRPLSSKAGAFDMAARLSLAYFVNSGADFIYEENHSDRGFEVAPGLSLSRRGSGGIFSALVDAPMVVTGKYDTGFLFSPRASFAFETPLYPAVTVGARVGVGYRAGAGDAPLKEGRGELQFVVLAGYQLL